MASRYLSGQGFHELLVDSENLRLQLMSPVGLGIFETLSMWEHCLLAVANTESSMA
jgi:hypothetical protein